jgi:citrate lyase subunit beta/citryl-CoA lyase
MALFRSYLFAPGNNQKLLNKVFNAGADAVVLDLEDAVPLSEKGEARSVVAKVLENRARDTTPPAYVRINGLDTDLWEEDLAVVVGPGLKGIRIPKLESAEEVMQVVAVLETTEQHRGITAGSIEVVCTIETAKGVWAAPQLARCPRVTNITFGATDFAQDLGIEAGPDELETLAARSRIVLASRVAGIDPPIASVYIDLTDEEGLRRSTEANRRMGFFGRSVIHPKQIPVVHEAFTPTPEAIRRAKKIIEALDRAEAEGKGTTTTEDGQFVDIAVVRRARGVIALAQALNIEQEKSS